MIRFMGDHTVDVPLWDDEGLMFSTPDELSSEWDLSPDLVAEIVAWARDWQTRAGQPDHDAQAARLVRRIKSELDDKVGIVYQP